MTFGELKSALGIVVQSNPKIDGALGQAVVDHILAPFYGGSRLDIGNGTVISPNEPEVVVTGRAPFLFDNLSENAEAFLNRMPDLAVTLRCRLSEESDPADRLPIVSLEFALPDTWKFTDSFPQLPEGFDPDETIQQPLLAYLTGKVGSIANSRFILRNTDGDGLRAGLNIVTAWTPNEALGAIGRLRGSQTALTLTGKVTLPSAAAPRLVDGQFPWEQAAPGISLHASLGVDRTLGDGTQLRLSDVLLRAYSPLTREFLVTNPQYEPAMGFSAKMSAPQAGTGVDVTVQGLKLQGSDAVQLSGAVAGVNLANLAQSLADIAGDASAIGLIPNEIRSTLTNIQLRRLAALVVMPGEGFSVSHTEAVVGLGLRWPPVGTNWPASFGTLSLDEAHIMVLNPFASGRELAGTLTGSFGFPAGNNTNVEFDVSVSAPVFELIAEQRGAADISLRALFERHFPGIPPPPELSFQETSIRASNDGSFEILMTLGPGKNWPIDPATQVPQIHVAISDSGWEFSGSSRDGIPIGKLFVKLAAELGVQFDVPASVSDATIQSFAVSRDHAAAKLTITCSGALPVDGLPEPVNIELEVTKQGQAPARFAGRITAAGVSFDLNFAGEVLLGTFRFREPAQGSTPPAGALGNRVAVGQVFDKLGLNAVASGLPRLEIAINSALLAIHRGVVNGQRKTKLVFALDVGEKIDLSGQAFAELKKLGLQISERLDLGIRLMVSSAGFTPAEVKAVNALLQGIDPLPGEARQGAFAVRKGLDAALRLSNTLIGQEPDDSEPPAGGGEPAPAPRAADDVKWFNIQRALGPFHLKRVGARFKDSKVCFLLDAGVSFAGLTLGLDGLSVCNPLDHFDPSFGLSGLSLGYSGAPIEIAGAFLKKSETEFAGSALIRTPQLSITAVGQYSISDPPSLFVFAVLGYPLGGPAPFFVTGLAAGFGYNRDLKVPVIRDVERYPLVRAVTTANVDVRRDLVDGGFAPPLQGAYWLAAGVRFTSFRLVESFALLLVKFGRDLEFALLGLSRLALPKKLPGVPEKPPYLQVELAIRVSVKPADGLFAAEARLTENSFVIDKSCRLTGGFAFYIWFGGSTAESRRLKGDFVVTLGGYHPRFQPPAHYPRVPRLGINWQVSSALTIKGEAYFALTPSCVMAGGGLQASYRDGSLRASFSIQANFLIRWEPFFYDIDVSISLSVAVVWQTILGPIRFGTSLTAALHIWGPEFAGIAHVSWSVISFDVEFGAISSGPGGFEKLSWNRFRDAFLPQPAEPGKGWAGPDGPLQICQVNIERGLDREVQTGGRTQWVVRPDELELSTQTAVPATVIQIGGTSLEGRNVGIRPMGGGPFTSAHKIQIVLGGVDIAAGWAQEPRRQSVPVELWSDKYVAGKPQPSADVLPERLVGVNRLRPLAPSLDENNPPARPISDFAFEVLQPDKSVVVKRTGNRLEPVSVFGPRDDSGNAFTRIRSTVMAASISTRRTDVIAAARASGFHTLRDGSLNTLRDGVETIFQSTPMLGGLGSGGRAPEARASEAPLRPPEPEVELIQTIVTLLLSVLQFQAAESDRESEEAVESKETREDVAFSLPAGQAVQQAVPNHDIKAGQSMVWSLEHTDPRQARETAVELTGGKGLHVRVVVLDRFRRPLRTVTLTGQPGAQRLELPSSAAHVTVTALPGPEAQAANAPAVAAPPGSSGWIGTSSLIQVASEVFLGDSATVEAQAQHRPAATPDALDTAVLRASGMVRRNMVQAGDGSRHRGWFRTFLPNTIQTLAVIVHRDSAPEPVSAGILVETERADRETLRLQPLHVFRDGASDYVLLYRVPAGLLRNEAGNLGFLTQGAGGNGGNWQIQGVVGIDERAELVRRKWNDFRLRPHIITAQPAQAEPTAVKAKVAIVPR